MPDSKMAASKRIRFGIPSLDELFGDNPLYPNVVGISLPLNAASQQAAKPARRPSITSLCIMGPDGTGKSVLGLHLASRYLADCHPEETNRKSGKPAGTRVIYISTDLTHAKASEIWQDFGLVQPNLREVPFSVSGPGEAETLPLDLRLELSPYQPVGVMPGEERGQSGYLYKYLLGLSGAGSVAFVDLATNSAGDDWGFVGHVVASLPIPDATQPKHLVILDAVEGLETYVGEVDAFGEKSTRRSRIVGLLRAASRRCHLVFISEEAEPGKSLPEQYVTDVLIRLRNREYNRYVRRTIEVEKARGQQHARGEHPFTIRSGRGSTTGLQENRDDPRTSNGYIQVWPSLHLTSRRIMKSSTTGEIPAGPGNQRAGFGIGYLDEMLGSIPDDQDDWPRDHAGVPYGSQTALIGDPGTHKTPLAHSFFLRGFMLYAKRLIGLVRELDGKHPNGEKKMTLAVAAMLLEQAYQRRFEKAINDPKAVAGKLGQCEAPREWKSLEEFWQDWSAAGAKRVADTPRQQAERIFELSRDRSMLRARDELVTAIELELQGQSQKRPVLVFHLAFCYYKSLLRDLNVLRQPPSNPKTYTAAAGRLMRYWGPDLSALLGTQDAAAPDYMGALGRGALAALATDYNSRIRLKKELVENELKRWLGTERYDASWEQPGKEILTRWEGETLPDEQEIAEAIALEFNKSGLKLKIKDQTVRAALHKLGERGSGPPVESGKREPDRPAGELQDDGLDTLRRVYAVRCHNSRSRGFQEFRRQGRLHEWLSSHYVSYGEDPDNALTTCWEQIRKLSGKEQRGRSDAVAQLARKLLNCSPRTHPYSGNAAAALIEELDGKTADRPVLRAALMSLLLGQWRKGAIAPAGGDSQTELTKRLAALKSNKHFDAWTNERFDDTPFKALIQMCAAETLSADLILAECRKSPAEEEEYPRTDDPVKYGCWILRQAARQGIIDGPSVLITTNDARIELLLDHYCSMVEDRYLRREEDLAPQTRERIREALRVNFREWAVIRRLEIHEMSSPVLFWTIARSVEAAQRNLLGYERWEKDARRRASLSWGIRIVIDNVSVVRDAYPDVRTDALFLPFLTAYIEREGLTALLVASQPGRPDIPPESEFDRELRNLVQNQIRTWQVPFFGETRVAIADFTTTTVESFSKVRELRKAPTDLVPKVDPHFELYQGLEKGELSRVPLEVRLYGETAAYSDYVQDLASVFNDLFEASEKDIHGKPTVISGEFGLRVERLRDFAHLHRSTKLGKTLVMLMDEYWALRRPGALRSVYGYLQSTCVDQDGSAVKEVDVYRLYQDSLSDPDPRARARAVQRYDRFVWRGYADRPEDPEVVDRVPYTWDFGFLLCRRDLWHAAGKQKLHLYNQTHLLREQGPNPEPLTVDKVWGALPDPKEPPADGHLVQPGVEVRLREGSWRAFVEATKVVASTVPSAVLTLDLAGLAPQSFSCLVLEIWASEIFRKAYAGMPEVTNVLVNIFARRWWQQELWEGMIGMIAEPVSGSLGNAWNQATAPGSKETKLPDFMAFSIELFKTFLLLSEMLDFRLLVDPKDFLELREWKPDPTAIAARHWYKTACEVAPKADPTAPLVAKGLPGHFSVRGDWYLAVARGSRSDRLADAALDILNSQRANIARFQCGLGLPVRKLTGDNKGIYNLRSPLVKLLKAEGGRSVPEPVELREILNLGAPEKDCSQAGFYWLWRSTLGNYDSHSRAWEKWLTRLLNLWLTTMDPPEDGWRGGLELYDDLDLYYSPDTPSDHRLEIFERVRGSKMLKKFMEECDLLVAGLRAATPKGQ